MNASQKNDLNRLRAAFPGCATTITYSISRAKSTGTVTEEWVALVDGAPRGYSGKSAKQAVDRAIASKTSK